MFNGFYIKELGDSLFRSRVVIGC